MGSLGTFGTFGKGGSLGVRPFGGRFTGNTYTLKSTQNTGNTGILESTESTGSTLWGVARGRFMQEALPVRGAAG